MFDIFTYFVYLSLMAVVIYFTYHPVADKNNSLSISDFTSRPRLSLYHYAALLIIAFIVGFRYDVGTDWEGYKLIYKYISYGLQPYSVGYNMPTFAVEWGYFLINKAIANIGGNSEIMFSIVALISWYFVFKSSPLIILPLVLYFLFVDEIFFWSMNGTRQFVALGIFLYSIQFIINRNLLKYILVLGLAALFHLTALILIPLYFVPFQKLYNQKYWFVAFIISLFLADFQFFVLGIENVFITIANYIPILSIYLGFFERGQYVAQELNVGLGYYFKLLIFFFILFFSKDVVKKYPQTKIYFVLFFIGSIIFNLFYMYQPIARVNVYFSIMRCYVLAIIVYQLWKDNKFRALSFGVVFLYFILFLSTIYNSSNKCSPYNFSF